MNITMYRGIRLLIFVSLIGTSMQDVIDNESIETNKLERSDEERLSSNEESSNVDFVPDDEDYIEADVRGGGGVKYTYYKTKKAASPKEWNKVFEEYCGGKRQSPIDLSKAKTMKYSPFKFKGYSMKPKKMMISNNGHSAVVEIKQSPMPTITGGGLNGTYEFLQMHWHWGSNNKKGSEHTENGKAFPIELHLVHWKKDYGDLETAFKNPDGLAVLGILIKKGNPKGRKSPYKVISRKIKGIKKDGSSKSVKPAKKLQDFLPKNTKKFYRYEGSLTTPTCNEIVIWTVFKKTMKIKESWLKRFRNMKDIFGKRLVNNYRPVQALSGRTIYKNGF